MKEYSISVSYNGYDYDFDKKIEKTVKQEAGGSGGGFGARDLNFYFKTLVAAQNAHKRLKVMVSRTKKYKMKLYPIEIIED